MSPAQIRTIVASYLDSTTDDENHPIKFVARHVASMHETSPFLAALGGVKFGDGRGLFDSGHLFPLGGDEAARQFAMDCGKDGGEPIGNETDAREWLGKWLGVVIACGRSQVAE